jgi:hypothetical protein
VGQAKEQAAQVAGSATERMSEVMGSARSELRERAKTEAGNVGSSLSSIAEELRAMGQASSENGGMTSGLVSSLADQVDRGAQRLSDGDLDQVLEDVKRFARNRPGAFLLGAAGAGFLVGRLLKAADLKEVGQAAKPSSQDDAQSLSSGSGNGNGMGTTGGQAAIPAPPTTPPPAAPPTSMGSATPSPTPNPGSTPTPGTPASPGAPS